MPDHSPSTAAPALKEIFNPARFDHFAELLANIRPRFDRKKFLALALDGLVDLSLLQRMRRVSESLHATLPGGYSRALTTLRQLAPRLGHGFANLVLPDFVGRYGLDHFELSLDALKFFTSFGSSEFAIREFLRRDLPRTLAVMETWSRDPDEHVRRLASEGSRPRLPWSFHLTEIAGNPSLAAGILENLRSDPSLYVRKSVGNHLNDVTKLHPSWVMDRLAAWPVGNPHTLWIARRALRTLIKQGDNGALQLLGATGPPQVRIENFTVEPRELQLGGTLHFTFDLVPDSPKLQRLVIDYTIRYARKSGTASAKVFKLREATLPPGTRLTLSRRQIIRDFTTRKHHPGRHEIEITINGVTLAKEAFLLRV